MTQRRLNLWGGQLAGAETLELHQNVEDNFSELYGLVAAQNYPDPVTASQAGVLQGGFFHTNGALKVQYQQIPVPGVGGLVLSGGYPVTVLNMARAPGVGALAISGVAPSVTQQINKAPGSGSLTLNGNTAVLS